MRAVQSVIVSNSKARGVPATRVPLGGAGELFVDRKIVRRPTIRDTEHTHSARRTGCRPLMLRILMAEPAAADKITQLERERRRVVDRNNVMDFRCSLCTARARPQLAEVVVTLQRELPYLSPRSRMIEPLFFQGPFFFRDAVGRVISGSHLPYLSRLIVSRHLSNRSRVTSSRGQSLPQRFRAA